VKLTASLAWLWQRPLHAPEIASIASLLGTLTSVYDDECVDLIRSQRPIMPYINESSAYVSISIVIIPVKV
jgi:hypothetical protein